MTPEADTGLNIFEWAVGLMFSAFGVIFGGWNLHIQKRVDELQGDVAKDARAGDDKLWVAMHARHRENMDAMAAMRKDQADQYRDLQAEIHRLRDGISEDRRHELDTLRQDIRNLKGS